MGGEVESAAIVLDKEEHDEEESDRELSSDARCLDL